MTASLSMDAVQAAVRQLPDNGLATARRAALAQLLDNGLPTTRHEDWKYTNLDPVIELSNQWLAAGAKLGVVSDAAVAAITSQFAAHWLVIRNGVVDATSVAQLAATGLHVELLSASERTLECDAPLSGLNVALLQDGLTIRVNAEAADSELIGLLFIDSAETEVAVSQARVVIDVQAGSAVNFIEYHASAGAAAHYANTVVEVMLGESARCDYVRLQDRHAGHDQTARMTATLGRDSQFRHAAFDLGGRLVRNDLQVKLAGAGSGASFCGLYLAGDAQHIDNHTRVDHLVGPTVSQQEYRGILADAAHCVWNGKAIVHRGANGADVSQANHNLLLSDTAEIDAKPELEIYTDEVKASHGTTIGELDKNALFYLRTRGLNQTMARRLLIRAFAQTIVTQSPLANIHEAISEKVAQRVASLIVGDAA